MNFFQRKFCQLYLNLLENFSSDDAAISKMQYFLKTGTQLNLENPTTFADKLQWLKLFYYNESFGRFADKYTSREVVKERVGESVLVSLIAIYDNVDAIEFEKLPQRFAMKCSHGSGFNLIVTDKSEIDFEKEKSKMRKYMATNYYYKFREKLYKNLKPVIIVEELLDPGDEGYLIDYKFQCFDGAPVNILIKANEDGVGKMAVYDLNWNKYQPDGKSKNYLRGELPKPESLSEMIDIATKLSEGFPFLRVDLYSIKGKVYFGELTFIPNGGAKNILLQRLNIEYGHLLKLPKKIKMYGFLMLLKTRFLLETYISMDVNDFFYGVSC